MAVLPKKSIPWFSPLPAQVGVSYFVSNPLFAMSLCNGLVGWKLAYHKFCTRQGSNTNFEKVFTNTRAPLAFPFSSSGSAQKRTNFPYFAKLIETVQLRGNE